VIEFLHVQKKYPNAAAPAIRDLSFSVPSGETCVLIGPSGSGKTTALKIINRLIEPTAGKVMVDGRNILEQNVVELRRNIGYVIQMVGLFPHMTIAENIAVVPRLLHWDANRIAKRVDELIELVGMEPAEYRGRYPRELSGGQNQRIGVARALAADPPVMLMDEPFGAIDPITREHLQNEFLHLQERLHKTIMFVTHDIDEAIKMGTVICLLREGGELVQLDSPANLLANPADDFVENFVGADRGLKRLGLVRVGEVMRKEILTGRESDRSRDLLERMRTNGFDAMLVVKDNGRLAGVVTSKNLSNKPDRSAADAMTEVTYATESTATMKDAFSEMLSYGVSFLPVIDEKKRLVGLVTAKDAQRLININTGAQAGD
jgi:osmoprotectant transport system ATP-binding protein